MGQNQRREHFKFSNIKEIKFSFEENLLVESVVPFVMNLSCEEARSKIYILEILPVHKNNARSKSHFGNIFK